MRLLALSETLPGKPVTNRDLAQRYGLHEEWLDRVTGNRSRYFCTLDSPPGVPKSTSDLATTAGQQALMTAGIDPSTLEFLILTTASPDHLMPATVNLVADRLGHNGPVTLQLMSGCVGALQGLFAARALLAGGLRRGLVIGADCCLKLLPPSGDVRHMKASELINFALFGDGAGAAVVDVDTDGPGLIVTHLFTRALGRGRKPAQVVRWFGADGAPCIVDAVGESVRESVGEEDYKAIEKHVPELASAVLGELSQATGWRTEDVEHVLTPQLNGVMTEKIRERLGVRADQAVPCVAETGNNGNALPFIQLHRLLSRIDTGVGSNGRVLMVTIESSKWLTAGMALRHRSALRDAT